MKTGMLSRAAVSQMRIELRIVDRQPRAVSLLDGEAEALADLLNAPGPRLDIGFELLRCRSSETRFHAASERHTREVDESILVRRCVRNSDPRFRSSPRTCGLFTTMR